MTTDTAHAPRGRWRRVVASPWFHLVAAFVVAGLVLSFVAKPYMVPSASMEPTLQINDRILVNRLAYVASAPETGDIVVFDAGPAWESPPVATSNPLRDALRWIGEVTGFGPSGAHTLVKRVIGTPGSTIECCDAEGSVTVNRVPLDEPYVANNFPFDPGTLDCTTTPRSLRCFDAVEVPEASYLVLGDNRSNSSDSAARCRGDAPATDCWRWVERGDIVGKTVIILWPIGRWATL